ncbi:MAG: 4Fe-4S dicluster domain-containing protein [Ruminococcaceae bacterium]|nr:4Fe-4S dicluster domain-containing protein [Oscillospiraceae bacterium]
MRENIEQCSACGACVQKCPRKCIELKADENGFLYPVIDRDACIGCDLCDAVCHLEVPRRERYGGQRAYAAVHRDKSVLRASTSGGAFTAIAEVIFSLGGVVYGCAYEKPLKAVHIRIEDRKDLERLNGSKYVQSEIGSAYSEVARDLAADRWVLFSGTPCQIAGLYAFLNGKQYDRLITVDIICHGVPSHAYFNKFLKWYEDRNGVDVSSFDFRSKKNAGWSCAGICEGTRRKDGRPYRKKIFHFEHYYYSYFLSADIYREGCYDCKYANLDRVGDYTLGDLWGAEGLGLPFSVADGCSLVLVNTEKASEMLGKIDMELFEIPIEAAVAHNEQLRTPSQRSHKREELLDEFRKCSAEETQKNYLKKNRANIIKARLKYMVPAGMRHRLLKLRYQIKRP